MRIYHFFPSLLLTVNFTFVHCRLNIFLYPSLWPLSAAVPAPSGRASRAPPSRRPKPIPPRASSAAVPAPSSRAPRAPPPRRPKPTPPRASSAASLSSRRGDASQPHRADAQRLPLSRRLSIAARSASLPPDSSLPPTLSDLSSSRLPAPTPKRRQPQVPNVGSPEHLPVRYYYLILIRYFFN